MSNEEPKETKTPIKIFSEKLDKVVKGIELIKSAGLSEEILTAWLCYRMKISKKKAKEIIYHTSEFYEEIVNKSTVEMI